MSQKYLLLWLEAPLQSWGADSKFGRRDTMPFPTKSGVIGLFLCAMGASGEQREMLEKMGELPHTVISYVRSRIGENGEQKKTERQPLLQDFHMVGSGYEERDPWETLLIPKTILGKKAVGGGTKITYRYYLQDAKFAVISQMPADLAQQVSSALQSPEYDLYLGRKNCVPTEFIYQGTFDSEAEALQRADAFKNVPW